MISITGSIFSASDAVGEVAIMGAVARFAAEFGAYAIRYSLIVGAITPVIAGVMFWLACRGIKTGVQGRDE